MGKDQALLGRYTVVYEGDPDGMKILSGEPAPGRAITVIVGDQWEEVTNLRARATAAEAALLEKDGEIARLRAARDEMQDRVLKVAARYGEVCFHLRECINQIEYEHGKFGGTGSGEAVLARACAVLAEPDLFPATEDEASHVRGS